ncbi:ABC1 kinase family protein [Luteimonas sp. JM171]|uniref:ABC1 kinase family protein n=1 Tax=Luteimonas sp. JM171 TaxID=1896164 RepID=UPI000AE0F702|nr:AarF/UbiB family protein [Luteimonas sp. JM171]
MSSIANNTHPDTGAAPEDPGQHQKKGLARKAQILGFLLRYRNAGVFSFDLEQAELEAGLEAGDADKGDPERFVNDLEALGPTFVKLGQSLSTRPDMVPPEYLEALSRMQDDVAPLSWEAVRGVIEDELGLKPEKVFAGIDEDPLGCASLAQVHRAVLRDGREVALKVQRPGIAEVIREDLALLAGIAERADRMTDLGRRLHFADWVGEFRRTLLAELDYRLEAQNLDRFDAHFANHPKVFVPKPVWDLTRPRLLTMELVRGTKATNISGLRRTEEDLGDLAAALMRAYLDQLFVHGEIHADPHPGNLYVTDDGRVALFDLGMVAHVPPRQRDRLLKLLFAAVDGRGEEVAAEGIAMGTRLEDFDENRYVRETSQLVARYAAQREGASMSEGRLVLELVRLATACGLRTPPELSLLGKTLLNLEQVARALDPELDVKQVVESHLQSVMSARLRKSFSPTNLASEAMELQALVREAPRKIGDVLSLLADNRMQVRVAGLEESHLLESLHKIANRITAGLVTAALIVGAALMMGVDGGPRLFGYPAIALALFTAAAAIGFAIVVRSLASDRKPRPREEQSPR